MKTPGEREIVERIRQQMAGATAVSDDVVVGIGDDAAVLKQEGKYYLLLTADMLVEGVHFKFPAISFRELGHRALAVNLSDIAAMGGIPAYCLVSMGIRDGITPGDIDAFYEGMAELAGAHEVRIVGGDTNYSPSGLILNICVTGRVEPGCLCKRNGAVPGDSVFVTGQLGAGAMYLKRGRYFPPVPRVKEARAIVKAVKVNAMIDISDGLGRDLHNVASSSGVGAVIESKALPVFPGADMAQATGGGEDYELLFTADARVGRDLPRIIEDRTGTPVTRIGEIVRQGVSIRNPDGALVPLPSTGYDHFMSR